MKKYFLLMMLLLAVTTFACNDHLYRLALNQRSFYNPSALCPYCIGSYFISGGLSFSPDVVGNGQMYALGNDGRSRIHGPADVAFAKSTGNGLRMQSFSGRYAWAQDLGGGWRASVGLRGSYTTADKQFAHEGAITNKHIAFADVDAGAFITNSQGVYAGFSVQHIPAFKKQLVSGESNSEITLDREFGFNAGGVIPVCSVFDVMADGNFVMDGKENATQLNSMIRLVSVVGVGGGVTFFSDAKPELELRGGITTTAFKFLTSIAFAPEGTVYEFGTVLRFERTNRKPWFFRPLTTQCTGGSCTPPHHRKKKKKLKDEFNPHA